MEFNLTVVAVIALVLLLLGVIWFVNSKPGPLPSPKPVHEDYCANSPWFVAATRDHIAKPANDFLNCVVKANCVRAQQILTLRDQLNILAFAYFPLKEGQVSYKTYTLSNRDHLTSESKVSESKQHTNDPVKVLAYYLGAMYTAIGDAGDAKIGGGVKLKLLQDLRDKLTKAAQKVFSKQVVNAVSWHQYLLNPGPQSWTVSGPPGVVADRAVYLGRKKQSAQFWGKVHPDQDTSFFVALSKLIKTQIADCKSRHTNLIKTNSSGWADASTILQSDNIDTFHKLRKSLRSLVKTIIKYPDVLSGLSVGVPAAVIQFSNSHMGSTLSEGIKYADLLCLGKMTASKCSVALGLMRLMFINAPQWPASWWGLEPRQLDGLRAVLLLYYGHLGTKVPGDAPYLRDLTGCPSSRAHGALDPMPYVAPSVSGSPFAMSGTVCELVDYFGDIHDTMVDVQQGKGTEAKNDFVVQTAQGLKEFMKTIDLDKMLDGLAAALC